MNISFAVLAGVAAAAAIGLAPVAAAGPDDGDVMYRVGFDIQPGDYAYRVVGNGMGSWELCSDAACEVGQGLIDMDTVDGMGHTGYLTVSSSAKFVKTNDLVLSLM